MDNVFDSMYYNRGKFIGGIDESGLIDIAGPVIAACVILPKIDLHETDLRIFEVSDSKTMPEKFRKQYAELIWQTALAIGIGELSPVEIDHFGISNSVKIAHARAILACKSTTDSQPFLPDFLMVDGHYVNPLTSDIPHERILKGDTKSLSIACASVVAKVYRDEIMIKLHEEYPYYNWKSNKGHPAADHLSGLDHYGITLGVHRLKSYAFSSKQFEERRKMWNEVTLKRNFQTLREEFSTLKKLSSKGLNNLEPTQPQ